MAQDNEINAQTLSFSIMTALATQLPQMAARASIMNVCLRAANMVADECNRSLVKAMPGMTIQQWFECDEVGLSSKYMALKLDSGKTRLPLVGYGYPHDADDFGRCLGLVRACGFENDIGAMYATGPEWAAIVTAWDRLVVLYETDNVSVFHEYLTSLIKGQA